MKEYQNLVEQIKLEVDFQQKENESKDEEYRKASEYHTSFIDSLSLMADKYPNFIEAILKNHIAQEEKIFDVDTTPYDLTPYEKGRIYSLIRCKHMLRVAKEVAI